MAQVVSVKNAVPTIELEEVVIGSRLNVAVQFERLVSENPDVYEPIDFSNLVLKAEIKDKPSKEATADAEFTCATRVDAGWVDFSLDGEASGALLERTYQASFKVWPTGHPEQGDTLLVIVLPMKFKATR